ncbi:MAG TPA: cation diffusion facilitator family transporter [Zeimonas sp.]|nr:cation diffusion facilitator family transporter [Zeimonas sp.]
MTDPQAAHQSHAHGAHAHAGDDHGHPHHRVRAPSSALGWSLLIVLGFGVLEVVVGLTSGSLALASDGVHMLTDSAALALAWGAQWLSRRRPQPAMSFGYGRIEPLAALVNGVFYLGVLGFIVHEAFGRMRSPPPIDASIALPVAIIGLLVNAAVWRLLHGDRHELNTRAALLHVIGDFAGSVIAIVALATVWFSGWTLIDPLLTLAISALLLVSTVRLLRESGRVLMNAAPLGVDPAAVDASLRSPDGVYSVHDLHLWSLGDGRPALAAHLSIGDIAHWPRILDELRRTMDERHGIRHLTLQPEAALDEALARLREVEAERDLQRDMALRFERELEAQRREVSGAVQRELGEQLAGLHAMAETLEARLARREPSLSELAMLIRRSAESMASAIRALVARVRSDEMQGESLPDGLRALVADWRLRHPGARIELLLDPSQDRDFGLGEPGVEALAWRIADHALERALGEGGADTVVVSAIREDAELRLQVSDDGRPWAAADDAGPASEAFEDLCRRAAAWSGRCAIARGEAGGTEVRAWLPWSKPAPE